VSAAIDDDMGAGTDQGARHRLAQMPPGGGNEGGFAVDAEHAAP